MRDLFLLAVLATILPLILRAPLIGLLVWMWVALMNPQREVYGFLAGFELNLWVALVTAFAWLMSKERKLVPLDPLSLLLILFALWACVATATALDRSFSLPICEQTLKTIVLGLAVAVLVNSRARMQATLWMFALSLGYYAVKGGGFVLLTGGRQHVYGPDNSMIADNNALGVALIVLLPLLNYLRVTSRARLVRLACLATTAFTLLAVVGTYSRGALVALAAAAAAYALKSRSGLVVVLLAGLALVSAPSLLPPSWFQRMATIQSYNEDASFAGRVSAWKTSLNIAKARPLVGGGFSAVTRDSVAQRFQSPGSLEAGKAAHSIYMEVLGDTGFVGLGLYLLVLAAAWINTFVVLHAVRGKAEHAWAAELARMLQVSLTAFMVGGAALSMAYYDGFIVLLVLTSALVQVVRRPAAATAPAAAEPRWKTIAAELPAQQAP